MWRFFNYCKLTTIFVNKLLSHFRWDLAIRRTETFRTSNFFLRFFRNNNNGVIFRIWDFPFILTTPRVINFWIWNFWLFIFKPYFFCFRNRRRRFNLGNFRLRLKDFTVYPAGDVVNNINVWKFRGDLDFPQNFLSFKRAKKVLSDRKLILEFRKVHSRQRDTCYLLRVDGHLFDGINTVIQSVLNFIYNPKSTFSYLLQNIKISSEAALIKTCGRNFYSWTFKSWELLMTDFGNNLLDFRLMKTSEGLKL